MFILSPESIRIDESRPGRVQFTSWSIPLKQRYSVSIEGLDGAADEVEVKGLARLLAHSGELLQALEDVKAHFEADHESSDIFKTWVKVEQTLKKVKGL